MSAQAASSLADSDRRTLARRLILESLDARWTSNMGGTEGHPAAEEEAEIVEAVMAALFGLGRLQHIIDNPDVENIDINGHDVVWVRFADGTKTMADPVASSDDELVELIRVAASRLGLVERRFDLARPELDLRLPDGSRLSAVMSVCERPCVSIRRHRYTDLDLADLVDLDMLSLELAALLGAAVRARKNIIVSGSMNSGKTTLLRALAAEIPPDERIVTIEQALELGLDKIHKRHPDCVALEARESNTEGEGEISMAKLVRRSLRMNADRVIVGEVLGDEVIPMLNAMSQGRSGSMCTIHSDSSVGVFRRIASYAAQAAERLSLQAANLLVAGSVNLVVHIDSRYEVSSSSPYEPHLSFLEDNCWNDSARSPFSHSVWKTRRLVRQVSSVREVVDADGPHVVSNEIWRPGSSGAAVPGAPLQDVTRAELSAHGYAVGSHGDGRW